MFDQHIGAVTPDVVRLKNYAEVAFSDPRNKNSHAVFSSAGGALLGLTINGVQIQPTLDPFPIPSVDQITGEKGAMRSVSHVMAPYGGGGTVPITPEFAAQLQAATGLDPFSILMYKHGFVSVLLHDQDMQMLQDKKKDSGATAALEFPGASFYPFSFRAESSAFFNADGSFDRWYAITARENLLDASKQIPVSIGFHNYKHVPGGDAGIAAVTLYDANERPLYSLSDYHRTEADQKVLTLPETYFIDMPHATLRVDNLAGFRQDSILNIWTDARYWRGGGGENYSRDTLKTLTRQTNERFGTTYSWQETRELIRNAQNNRYFCDEPLRPGFNTLRKEPGPVLLNPGETLRVGQRTTVVAVK